MTVWNTEYIQMLDDCDAREQKLTEWERTFSASLQKQLNEGKLPTQKQLDVLDRMREKATSRK